MVVSHKSGIYRALVVTFVLVVPGCAPNGKQPWLNAMEQDLLLHIAKDSQLCGFVALGQPSHEAVTCARHGLATSSPFHVAFQVSGVDSVIWRALVTDASGFAQLALWDSNPSGRRSLRPRLQLEPCAEPVVTGSAEEPLSCFLP